jgi:GAF domain-containing protein
MNSSHDCVNVFADLWRRSPRGYSVCEHTVMLSPPAGSNNTNAKDDHHAMVHIVNDLSEDFRFCDRPFVTGGPRAKFYAGVPITTPKGEILAC